MTKLAKLLLLIPLIALVSPVLAGDDDDDRRGGRIIRVDCDKGKTIAKALRRARPGDTIQIEGFCEEEVRVTTDRVSLVGLDGAVVDGGGGEPTFFAGVIVIEGVQGVKLEGLIIQNGPGQGILAQNGAAFAAEGLILRDNANTGMFVTGNSTADLTDITVERSGTIGLAVQDNSTAVLKGPISVTESMSNGIAIQSRSVLEIRGATVEATKNGGSGFDIVDSTLVIFGFPESQGSSLVANENGNAGIFIALGSLQAFGGGFEPGSFTISASNNGSNGIQVVGGGNITSPFGTTDIILENNPTGLNFGDGAGAIIVGGLTVRSNETGLSASGADALTLVSVPPNPSSIEGNGTDVNLSFGSRARIVDVAFGSFVCDATVLLEGNTGLTCPIP